MKIEIRNTFSSWFANPIVLTTTIILLASPLTGCVGAFIGAGTTVGKALSEERGLKSSALDLAIRAQIIARWLEHNEQIATFVALSISEGRVLLTGTLHSQQMRLDAVRLAWQVKEVKEIINEIKVSNPEGLIGFVRDGWITTQLKTRLALDPSIESINYTVETLQKIVYLMGIAQDAFELNRVKNHAQEVKHVRQVISYVYLKDDPRRLKPRAQKK